MAPENIFFYDSISSVADGGPIECVHCMWVAHYMEIDDIFLIILECKFEAIIIDGLRYFLHTINANV